MLFRSDRGLADWISDIKLELLFNKHKDRRKSQRKILLLEKARFNLAKNYNNWINKIGRKMNNWNNYWG